MEKLFPLHLTHLWRVHSEQWGAASFVSRPGSNLGIRWTRTKGASEPVALRSTKAAFLSTTPQLLTAQI